MIKLLPGSNAANLQRAVAAGTICLGLALGPLTLAHAQYKVVQPDGSVTYTDRPPTASEARITPLRGGKSPAEAPASGLPQDLRLTAQRHPVTLYTSADCAPCDAARRLLQQRGVPYAEKRIASNEDIQALERLVGSRVVPSVTIGAQPLRGFTESDWTDFLDSAGYPRESKLPRGWKQAEVTPLAERTVPRATAAAPAPRPTANPAEAPAAPPPPPAPPGGTIRF
jgi:glutaredoxin